MDSSFSNTIFLLREHYQILIRVTTFVTRHLAGKFLTLNLDWKCKGIGQMSYNFRKIQELPIYFFWVVRTKRCSIQRGNQQRWA